MGRPNPERLRASRWESTQRAPVRGSPFALLPGRGVDAHGEQGKTAARHVTLTLGDCFLTCSRVTRDYARYYTHSLSLPRACRGVLVRLPLFTSGATAKRAATLFGASSLFEEKKSKITFISFRKSEYT
jgi:hypothetical protein